MSRFSSFMTRVNIMSLLLLIIPFSLSAQDVIAPPSLGQQSQGELTSLSESTSNLNDADQAATENEDAANTKATRLLGATQFVERRGEDGQVYRIELEHSNGSKQYIERDYSNGGIGSKSNNIDEIPNLAKWRLGSW